MDSLVLSTYQLIQYDPATWSLDKAWDYQLLASSDLGAPVPDTAVITGVLLDGDRVTGDRSGNRQVVLPIAVKGIDRVDLAAKVNKLIRIVDGQFGSYPLIWTPDGGYPLILDCYRGPFSRSRDLVQESNLFTLITLTFPAAPFGRSDAPITIAATSPQVPMDSMDTAPTGATLDTANHLEGSGSAAVVPTRVTSGTAHSYQTVPVSNNVPAKDLTNISSVGVRFRWPAPIVGSPWYVTLTLTLSDGVASYSIPVQVAAYGGSTAWQWVMFSLSGLKSHHVIPGVPRPNVSAITHWQIDFVTDSKTTAIAPTATPNAANYDDLRGFPSSSAAISTPEGAVVTVPDVPGTARAPVSLTADHGGTVMTGVMLHRPPVDQNLDTEILAQLTANTVTIAAGNNAFHGTYEVWLLMASTTAGSGTRTVTVTFTHKQGSTTIGTASVSATYSSLTTGKFLDLGSITLPIVAVPAENNTDTTVITVSSSGGVADTFTDVALLDLRGQTVVVGSLPAGTTILYIDEPDPSEGDVGQLYVSPTDRTAATSVFGQTSSRAGGGPFSLEPGDDRILAASPDGPPNINATLYARWMDEREV